MGTAQTQLVQPSQVTTLMYRVYNDNKEAGKNKGTLHVRRMSPFVTHVSFASGCKEKPETVKSRNVVSKTGRTK